MADVQYARKVPTLDLFRQGYSSPLIINANSQTAYYADSVSGTVKPLNNGQLYSLWDFVTNGVAPSAISDWTPYINLAIAWMNTTGQCVRVPPGTYPFTNAASFIITAGGFLGAGIRACTFSTTNTNGQFFQLGSDALAEFACIDVNMGAFTLLAVNGTTSGQTPAIQVKNAFRTRIHDIFMNGVGRAVWINGVNVSVDTYMDHITVAQSLVNEDVFQVSNGSVSIFDYCKAYLLGNVWPPAATPVQTAGAAFACRPAANTTCDTFKVLSTCECLYLFDGCALDVSNTNSAIYSPWLNGTFDSNVNAGLEVTGAGTILYIVTGKEFWATSYNGYGVRLAPSGVCDDIQIGGRILHTGADGAYLGGTITNVSFDASVEDVGRLIPGSYNGVVIAGSAEAITIVGSKLGGGDTATPTQTAQYGISVQRNILRLNVTGCNLQSTIKGIQHFTYTTASADRICANNSGDSGNLGYQSGFTLPASTFPYTNLSPYQQDIYLTGGVVTVVAKNGTTLFTAAGSYTITLGPAETMTLTYTVAPTVKMFQR